MPSSTIELRGHIIDSLILPKVLDEIIARGGTFKIGEIRIGEQRTDQSFARIEVSAPGADELDDLILRLRQHGAEVRFIEYMDVGGATHWAMSRVMPRREMLTRLEQETAAAARRAPVPRAGAGR